MTIAFSSHDGLHARQVLEFDKVRDLIASYALTDLGRSHIRTIEPSNSREAIESVFMLTSELEKFLDLNKTPILVLHDIRPFYKHIKVENSVLGSQELFQIRSTLENTLKLRALFEEKQDQFPGLADFSKEIRNIIPLMPLLTKTFSETGEIKDDATDILRHIRNEMKTTARRLKSTLANIASSPAYGSALEDRDPVIYENRYVFRIKSASKNKLRGILHGSSSSGQTYYFEPEELIAENNLLRELTEEEEMEIYRILFELTKEARLALHEIEANLVVAEKADHLFANVLFSRAYRCVRPIFNEAKELNIRNGRHPFIKDCIPMTVRVENPKRILVISGPNTGGKTVALKIAGLSALMANSGFPLPADPNTTLPFFDQVFVDLGDEQSIEHSLSTFSAHLINMKTIMENATTDSLVLMDEPGIGTEPEFGEVLAETFLKELKQRDILTLITTHYKKVKLLALDDPTFLNACVDYDPETLTPFYKILYDVPGDSNPMMIMKRIAFPAELTAKIAKFYSEQSFDLAGTVRKLLAEKQKLENESAAVTSEKEEYERLSNGARLKTEEVRRKEKLLRQTYSKTVKDFLDKARSRFETIVKEMSDHGRDKQRIKEGHALFNDIEAFTTTMANQEEIQETSYSIKPEKISIGDRVRVKHQHYEGEVVDIRGTDAVLQAGIMKTNVKLDELIKVKMENAIKPAGYQFTQTPIVKQELDLRGLYQSDAREKLEEYYDNLLLSRMPSVRIIHGRGTGRVREMVRDFCKEKLDKREIHKFYSPKPEDGGDGVTIVEI